MIRSHEWLSDCDEEVGPVRVRPVLSGSKVNTAGDTMPASVFDSNANGSCSPSKLKVGDWCYGNIVNADVPVAPNPKN